MKGERTIHATPFRYGGIEYDYEKSADDFAQIFPKMRRCYACGGHMKGHKLLSGKEITVTYPYMASFRITRGKKKGQFHFETLCRWCAYQYGRGVIEMDGNTYNDYNDFNEHKFKKEKRYHVPSDE